MKSGELANQIVNLFGNVMKGLTAMRNAANRVDVLDNNIESRAVAGSSGGYSMIQE